jgi:hypothetical protein
LSYFLGNTGCLEPTLSPILYVSVLQIFFLVDIVVYSISDFGDQLAICKSSESSQLPKMGGSWSPIVLAYSKDSAFMALRTMLNSRR